MLVLKCLVTTGSPTGRLEGCDLAPISTFRGESQIGRNYMYSLAESQVWCVQKSFFPIEILLFANSNRSKNVLGFFSPLNACIITAYEGLESSWLVQSDILEEGDLQSGPSGTVIP